MDSHKALFDPQKGEISKCLNSLFYTYIGKEPVEKANDIKQYYENARQNKNKMSKEEFDSLNEQIKGFENQLLEQTKEFDFLELNFISICNQYQRTIILTPERILLFQFLTTFKFMDQIKKFVQCMQNYWPLSVTKKNFQKHVQLLYR